MKYIRKTSYDIKENFLENLLKDRNIIQNDQNFNYKFFNPTKDNELSPSLMDNMEEGYQLLKKHLEKKSKIYLPLDPDCDGIGAGTIAYLYLKSYNKDLEIIYHVPDGKEHGLSTIMDWFPENGNGNLIFIIDSSSNDYEEHLALKNRGYEILCCDHHNANKYSENAIVINNQLSQKYENKMLCGAGVLYKFFEYCEEKGLFPNGNINNYLDLVAFTCTSDMMAMTTLENRFICDYGLTHINNNFLKSMIEKQSYSIGDGPLTQIDIAFYITPLINALIRVGSQIEKERLFLAFINPDLEVPSTKRGEKGQTETVCEQSVRNCVNAKAKQNRLKDKALELLDIQIMENCLDENKILILNADDLDVPTTITGLCAMGVAAKYKKPTILGRISSDNILKGSLRGKDDCELKDFRGFLIDSGLVEYAEG